MKHKRYWKGLWGHWLKLVEVFSWLKTQKNNPLKFVIIQASWLCNSLSLHQRCTNIVINKDKGWPESKKHILRWIFCANVIYVIWLLFLDLVSWTYFNLAVIHKASISFNVLNAFMIWRSFIYLDESKMILQPKHYYPL